jgi:hypothetical protein
MPNHLLLNREGGKEKHMIKLDHLIAAAHKQLKDASLGQGSRAKALLLAQARL